MHRKFLNRLRDAKHEEDIRSVYQELFYTMWPSCKALAGENKEDLWIEDTKTGVRILCEIKAGELSKGKFLYKTLAQSLLYYRIRRDKRQTLPTVLLLIAKDFVYVFSCDQFNPDLFLHPEWFSSKPSDPPKEMVDCIIEAWGNDKFRSVCTRFEVDSAFEGPLKYTCNQASNYFARSPKKMLLSSDSLKQIFEIFCMEIASKLKINEKRTTKNPIRSIDYLRSLFVQVLINADNLKATNTGDIMIPDSVESNKFTSLPGVKLTLVKSLRERIQLPSLEESQNMLQNFDLVFSEERVKRCAGNFYTPIPWVRAAHTLIESVCGIDWRQTHIVWDASCGTGNLTCGYDFKYLLESTLDENDIDLLNTIQPPNEMESIHVRKSFDFLKSYEVPPFFKDFFKKSCEDGKKPLIFINNPPFKAPVDFVAKPGDRFDGNSESGVKNSMKIQGFGQFAENLCDQFLWQQDNLCNKLNLSKAYIAIFLPANHWSRPRARHFLVSGFFKRWQYCGGFMFNKSDFEGTHGSQDNWAVSFTVWERSKSPSLPTLGFPILIQKISKCHSCVPCKITKKLGTTLLSILDENFLLRTWAKENSEAKSKNIILVPPMTSHVNIKKELKHSEVDELPNDAIGYINAGGNGMDKCAMQNNICSSAYANGHGWAILKSENTLLSAVVFYSVRQANKRSVSWTNAHLQFQRPNKDRMTDEEFRSFEYDCLVFALFSENALLSSFGIHEWMKFKKGSNIQEKRQAERRNQFFFCTIDEVKTWAIEIEFLQIQHDITKYPHDTFVATLLSGNKSLSENAMNILRSAKDIIQNSMHIRKNHFKEEYYLAFWDAGWNQLFYRRSNSSFLSFVESEMNLSFRTIKNQLEILRTSIIKNTMKLEILIEESLVCLSKEISDDIESHKRANPSTKIQTYKRKRTKYEDDNGKKEID